MPSLCQYVKTGALTGIAECSIRNSALLLNGNRPDVCLTCSAYLGKKDKKIDVNEMGPEARRALLNFIGGFIDLEALLISKGATKDDIRAGAIQAIDTIMSEDPKKKDRILKTFKRFNRGGL